MKKLSVALMLTTLVSILMFSSCKVQKDSEKISTAIAETNTLLWKIEGKGIKPSHIYGTIHMIAEKDYFMNKATEAAFAEAEQVVMELDMDDPTIQGAMMRLALMEDGMTLDKLLSKEDFKKVDDLMKETMGMGVGMFNGWQPMLLTSFFLPQFIEGPSTSYEASFMEMAQSAGKEIFGLETVEEQMAAIGSMTMDEQVEMLMETVNDIGAAKKLFSDMVDVYQKQDINSLHKFILEQNGGDVMAEKMIDGRNEDWIPKIGAFSKDKKTFYAVGGGHLGGKNGVISLLLKAGYKVTPVENNAMEKKSAPKKEMKSSDN